MFGHLLTALDAFLQEDRRCGEPASPRRIIRRRAARKIEG